MTSKTAREKAEEIVDEWYASDEWRPDSNFKVLVNKIKQALHQAVLEERKRCIEVMKTIIDKLTDSDDPNNKYTITDNYGEASEGFTEEISKEIMKEEE